MSTWAERNPVDEDYLTCRLQWVKEELSLFAQAVVEKPTPSHALSWSALSRYETWLLNLQDRVRQRRLEEERRKKNGAKA